MKFSYNWLKELTGLKESPEKLAELLNLHSFEVEKIEKTGSDFVLDAKIPTNRISDAGNHIGLSKEIGAILGKRKTQIVQSANKVLKPKTQNTKAKPLIQVKIAKPEFCTRYTAAAITIKTAGPSPKWMQERLKACGLRPINILVDVTNYVMIETGQPMHAFDLDKVKGGKMTIREAKPDEKLTTLDGTTHQLPEGAIIIEDAERLIDLAGIMGGENSAVSEDTRRILLQAATFDPVKIYRTTRALNFSSDAAKIYSAGSDPNKTAGGLLRALEILNQTNTLETIEKFIDIYPRKTAPQRIVFRPDYADRIIGEALGEKFHKRAFERLGFKITRSAKSKWIVEVPTDRKDLQIEEDLVEEAVRMHGFYKLPAKLPEGLLAPAPRNDEFWLERKVADFMKGAGFTETFLYEFIGGRELDKFTHDPEETLVLENSMNPETKYLTPRALIKYVHSTAENLRNFNQIKFFGIGRNFLDKKVYIEEQKNLIAVLAGSDTPKEGFYLLKGALDQLFEQLGIADHWYDDAPDYKLQATSYKLFHPYRFAEIKIGDEKIGNIGEIHPTALENLKTKTRIAAAEIDFEKLWRAARAEQEFRPIGKYPAIVRDIAVVVPSDAKADEVQEIIENIGGQLLVDSDLFDYFQDEAMEGRAKKSLAFHLVFQSPERTLTDEEISRIYKKIASALMAKGWEVR